MQLSSGLETRTEANTATEPPQAAAPEGSSCSTVRLEPSQVLVLAVWFGVLTGFGEIAIAGFKVFGQGQVVRGFPELLWMVPLADILLLALPGLVLALAAWLRPGFGSLRLVTFVYLTLAIFCLLLYVPGLRAYAKLLLALGLSSQVSRFLARHPRLLNLLIAWTTGWVRPLSVRSAAGAVHGLVHPDDASNLVDRRQILVGSTAALAGLATGIHGWEWVKERRALAGLPAADRGMPNVLFMVLDTVRAQSLSLHGYSRPTSPNLERLAKDGVCFQRAIASAPWTLPSHAGMFTGRPLQETGVNFGIAYTSPYPTLAEVLYAQGYETAGFVGNTAFLCPCFGLNRGFAHYESWESSLGQIIQTSALLEKVVNDDHVRAFLGNHQNLGRKTAAEVNQDFLYWIERRAPGRPFFAFLNYFDCHTPYIPSKALNGRFAPHARSIAPNVIYKRYSSDELDAMRAAYDECILDLDLEVGQLLEKLRERGHLDNTLIIITSDHGEHFGEHDLVDHCFSLYMPLLHVPLILLHPSRVPVGTVIQTSVSLLDLPQTVCGLIGLGYQAPFPGSSLARFWEARGALQASRDVPILSQAEPPPYTIPSRYPVSKGAMQSLIWRDYHYLKNGDGSEELYHLGEDSHEENNLAGSAAAGAVLKRLRASLKAGGVV